jgi:pimeloyl-ACP methyl ester carboxylesterase
MESVVIVHGLWMPGVEMLLLQRRLEAAGFATRVFRYRSVRDGLDANAERLAEFVTGVPGDTVHFVGHSLGGVLILCMLERFAPEHGGRVVCLGSPLTGSCSARAVRPWPGGPTVLGKCMLDLLERGGCARWNGPRELGIVAGRVSIGLGCLLSRLGLGQLTAPNDGMVAIDETRLPGATDHIVVRASHTSLLWSAEAAREVAHFLRHGRFGHESLAAAASS